MSTTSACTAYLTYRPARLHRLEESIPGLLGNLTVCSITVYIIPDPVSFPVITTDPIFSQNINVICRAASKSPHLDIFFLLFSKKFLPISFNFSPKTEGTKTKAARCLFFLMSFPFLYILNSLQSSLTVYILPSLSAC